MMIWSGCFTLFQSWSLYVPPKLEWSKSKLINSCFLGWVETTNQWILMLCDWFSLHLFGCSSHVCFDKRRYPEYTGWTRMDESWLSFQTCYPGLSQKLATLRDTHGLQHGRLAHGFRRVNSMNSVVLVVLGRLCRQLPDFATCHWVLIKSPRWLKNSTRDCWFNPHS